MNDFQTAVLEYLFNSLWQLPLVFAAAWIAARLVRPAGPRAEHRVWVAALLAETMLAACNFDLVALLQQAWALLASGWRSNPGAGQTRVIVGPGSAAGAGLLHLSAPLMAAILIAYGGMLTYFAVRLGWGLWKTSLMLRDAHPAPSSGSLAARLQSYSSPITHFEQASIYVAVSPLVSSPVTLGLKRCVLLLPLDFLECIGDADLDAVLAHEAAHMQRRDFAKNLLYNLVTLSIAWHPMFWLTLARLAESREMVCDEIAANSLAGKETYAQSLLRLASMLTEPMPAKTLHAIGIFDANIFERRIMNLAQNRIEITTLRRLAIAASCLVIAAATCASALALHVEVPQAPSHPANPKTIHVKEDSLKLVSHEMPVYPPPAKLKGIQGAVVLEAIIGKDGVPMNLKVQKGPKELQASALDAVRQWRWQPYLLNGDPIEVETTVTVVYSLPAK